MDRFVDLLGSLCLLTVVLFQAVVVTVYSWLLLGVVASQELIRTEQRDIWYWALIVNFPWFQVTENKIFFLNFVFL